MTAPVPAPQLSPMAGLFNLLAAYTIRLLDLRALDLEAEVAVATHTNQQLKGDEK